MALTANEERELLHGVRDLRKALLGDLEQGTEGVLHKVNRMHTDFYHPENPTESVHHRLRLLENTETKRGGIMIALSAIGGFVAFIGGLVVHWWKGDK